MKKLLSLILASAMCLSLTAPAFATNATNSTSTLNVIDSKTDGGTVTYEISEKSGIYYFFEMYDDKIITGTLDTNLVFNYCLKLDDGIVIQGTLEYGKKYNSDQYKTIFSDVKRCVFSRDNIPGITNITSYSDYIPNNNNGFTRAQNILSDEDKSKIDSALFSRYGEPEPYTKKYLGAYGTPEHRAELYETLQYLYSNQGESFFFQAYTAASVIAAVVSLPTSTVALILTLVLNSAGIYVSAKDANITKYTVTQLFSKYVYVDKGTNPTIAAARQVMWAMNVGNKDAMGDIKSENTADNYNLSNNELMKLAIQKIK